MISNHQGEKDCIFHYANMLPCTLSPPPLPSQRNSELLKSHLEEMRRHLQELRAGKQAYPSL